MDVVLSVVGVIIALTQAGLAIAVFQFSHRQKLMDRGTQRIIRVHEWGNECIDALAEAGQFCLLRKTDFEHERAYSIRKSELLHKLSALIDRGRLFYTNVDKCQFGLEKFPARRGYRPEILDPVVAAYRSVLEMNGTANHASFQRLYRWRGRFVTLLQYEVDPNWLQRARHYSNGPGTGPGVSVTATSEPPKWPEDRYPA